MKIKENKKKNEFFDLARELKKLQNLKVTVISIVIVHEERSPKVRYGGSKRWKSKDEPRLQYY